MHKFDTWAREVGNRVSRGLAAWRTENIAALVAQFDEGVEFVSLYAPDGIVRGKIAVLTYLAGRRAETGHHELVDILLGAGVYTIILRERAGLVVWQCEINEAGLVRRVVASHSVGPDLGDAQPIVETPPRWRR